MSVDYAGLSDAQLAWAVSQATRAPSINNTQPWRFRWNGNAILLEADLRRGLVRSDPEGREMVISCGAALLNLRVALPRLGRRAIVTPFPDTANPRLLARIDIAAQTKASDAEQRRFNAISRRHTHRGSFLDLPLDPALAVRIQEAATAEGAELLWVNDPGPLRQLLHFARAAERARAFDDAARQEMDAWTSVPAERRRDGVPASAFPAGPPVPEPHDLPGRDFDLGRGIGRVEAAPRPRSPIAVLASPTDLSPDWLRAGQALEAVLLTAAAEWTFARLHSRVSEVPSLRMELRRALGTASYPHVLLRFGHSDNAPTTPRRPITDVIQSGP